MQNLIRSLPYTWSAGFLGAWTVGLVDLIFGVATSPYALPNNLGLALLWILGVGAVSGVIAGSASLLLLGVFLIGDDSPLPEVLEKTFRRVFGPRGSWKTSAVFGSGVALAWGLWNLILYQIEIHDAGYFGVHFFVLAMLGEVAIVGLAWVVYRLFVFRYPKRAGDPLHLVILTSVAALVVVGGPVLRAVPLTMMLPCFGLAVLSGIPALLWYSRLGLPKSLRFLSLLAPLFLILTVFTYDTTSDEHDWLSRHLMFYRGSLDIAQVLFDSDSDGFSGTFGGDCDDSNPMIHPQALEIVGNGVDENCTGADLASFSAKAIQAPQHTGPLKSVLFVSVDTLRHDFVGKTYEGHSLTPTLDALAADSRVMQRAYTPSTHTFESVPAIMSGGYPASWHQNGEFFGLESTIAQHLSGLGYETSAVLSMPKPNEALAWGFQSVDARLAKLNRAKNVITGPQTTEAAIAEIDTLSADKPFLLWVHYFDPHDLYLSRTDSPEWIPERPINTSLYAQEVHGTDQEIGKLFAHLKEKGLWENLVIVFFSDHGEGLGEFGVRFHLFLPNESIIRGPWMMRVPGEEPALITTPVSLIRMRPTLYEVLGLQGDFGTPVSQKAPIEDIFLEANFGAMSLLWVMIRGPWKLVQHRHSMSWALYNLDDDPNELTNLMESRPEKAKELQIAMGLWRDEQYNSESFSKRTRTPLTPAQFLPKTLRGALVPGH